MTSWLDLVRRRRATWSSSSPARTYERVRSLDLDTYVLAFSAQQVLCTAPLVIAVSSILIKYTSIDVSIGIARLFGLHPKAATAVRDLLAPATGGIGLSGLVGSLILTVVFATGVASVQQHAFELIFGQQRLAGLRTYLRQLLWVAAFAAFLAGLLLIPRVVHGAYLWSRPVGAILIGGLQLVIILLFNWWSQYWLLSGRLAWRSLLPGSFVVAGVSLVAIRFSLLFMDGQITFQIDAYGPVGVAFVLSIWMGIFSAIVFFGVLAGALWSERRARHSA